MEVGGGDEECGLWQLDSRGCKSALRPWMYILHVSWFDSGER